MNIIVLWIWFKAHFWGLLKVFWAIIALLFAFRGLFTFGVVMIASTVAYRFWFLQ